MSSQKCSLLILLAITAVNADFNLLILHTNDMHARFEQTNRLSSKCGQKDVDNNNCFGGFARVAHEVREAKRIAKEGNGPPVLFLNAGDTYQGTVWYTVHKWRIVAKLMAMLGIDVSSLGNHEFDDGVSGLVPYINNVSFPVLASNLDLSKEPTLSATHLAKSTVITVAGKKIGVIGYLTTDTKDMSSSGLVVFLDEVENVRKEAVRLKTEGVEILIALGHAGYEMDKRIAAEVPDIDIVVGGHTNTFLYSGKAPDPTDMVEGKYPTNIRQKSGKIVPVVQAYAFTKYLGRLSVTFNDHGDVITSSGNPVLLDNSIPQDQDVLDEIGRWRGEVIKQGFRRLGSTRVYLNGDQRQCRIAECNMGNLITDAMVDYYVATSKVQNNSWTDAPIALINGGGIRGSIDVLEENGVITMQDLLTTLPFDNSVSLLTLKGEHLLEAIEWGVYGYIPGGSASGAFLQFSGLHIKYDVCKPPGKRVLTAMVRCGDCREPVYKPVDPKEVYTILLPSYIAQGGDGFKFSKNVISQSVLDITDAGILGQYITKTSPIYPESEGRITFADFTACKKRDVADDYNSATVTSLTHHLIILAIGILILT